MKTDVIAMRVDQDTSDLIKKLIKYKISANRTEAVRTIMRNGVVNTKRAIERKEKSQSVIKRWLKKGFPELPENLSEISIEERK